MNKFTFILLFLVFKLAALELNFSDSQDLNFQKIDAVLQNNINYNNIEFKVDYNISTQELEYLLGLPSVYNDIPAYAEVTSSFASLVKSAYQRLKQKNKFKKICIEFGDTLIINLESDWTISKIKLSGISDKEKYKALYLLDIGQIFDPEKHNLSIVNIKKQLFQDGYCDSNIEDSILYDDQTKTVDISLNLKNNSSYKIIEAPIKVIYDKKDIVDKIIKKYKKLVEKNLVGHKYSEDLINQNIEILKNYLKSIGFLTPKIDFSITTLENCKIKVNINLTLDEQKIFTFMGNHFFTTAQLFKKLKLTDSLTSILPGEILVEDLKHIYKANGFWQADITFKKDNSQLYFIISEGNRSKINTVKLSEFENNKEFNSFLEKSFSSVINKEISEKNINKALNDFKNYFIQAGYWDYFLEDKQYTSKSKKDYDLILYINPGKQRLIKKVLIPNFPDLESHSYFSDINNSSEPKPFNENIISEQKNWLYKYLSPKYQVSEIKPEIKIENDGALTLIWHVIAGNSLFGKTIVIGNKNVPTNIILRELQYNEGESFAPKKISESIKRLKNLNVFDSITIQKNPEIELDSNQVPLVLKCIEDDQFEIKGRLGAQVVNKSFTRFTGTTYKVGGSFIYKNPFKQADIISFDGDYTRFGYNLKASYGIPGIGPYPIRTLFSGYATTYEQKFVPGHTEKIYKESHEGFSVENNLLKSYTDSNCRYSLRSGIENMKISDISVDLAKTIDFSPILINKRICAIYFEPVAAIDWLDNSMDPNSGIKTLLSGKMLFPVNIHNAHFVKIFAEQAFYLPLIYSSHSYLPKLTLATRFRIGHIFTPDFKRILPYDRFYLGGPESLRGYEPNMAPPLNSIKQNKDLIWVPIGSKTVANMNLELRFGIYKSLSGVVFNDLGFLSQNFRADIALKNILGSTGYGLRLETPIGMLRFDMGFKWKKRHENDKIYAWFLAFGHAF